MGRIVRKKKPPTLEQEYANAVKAYDAWKPSASNKGRKPQDPRTSANYAEHRAVESGANYTVVNKGRKSFASAEELKIKRGQRYVVTGHAEKYNRVSRLAGSDWKFTGFDMRVLHDPPAMKSAHEDQIAPDPKRKRLYTKTSRVAGRASGANTIGTGGGNSLSIEPTRGIGLPT